MMAEDTAAEAPTEVVLRRAEREDVDAIAAIEQVSFPTPWSRSLLASEVRQADSIYLVATIRGRVVGFVGMWHVMGEGHICTLAVAPEHRGQGLGELLVLGALDAAVEVGADAVHLEYRVGNEAAAELYGKLDFQRVGRRPRYYSDTGEDAILARINGLCEPEGSARLDRAWKRWERERSLRLVRE
ncbi:MAG: ribosomal protein S18-alanine N-acetyltransferase [Armatimonadota bacterium]|nr:ribosomal protein S18-alanine N-acetyltransferase [Armatimonadota bacterium]